MKLFSRILGNGQTTIAERELYLFKFGNSERCYTNGDAFIEYEGRSFEPHVIERQSHKRGRDLEKETMEIEFSLQSEFAQNLSRSELEELVTVEMFSYKHDTFKPFWTGRLTKVKPHNNGIKLQFETSYTKVGRNAITRKIQASCPYRLFDHDCRVDQSAYEIRTTIKSINKLNIELRGLELYPENYFAIGMIQHPDQVLITVESSNGNHLVLKRRYDSFSELAISDADLPTLYADIGTKQTALDNAQIAVVNAQDALDLAQPEDENYQDLLDVLTLAQSQVSFAEQELQSAENAVPYVIVLPGCARTPTACKAFANMPNYGGFPFLPTDNPLAKEIA